MAADFYRIWKMFGSEKRWYGKGDWHTDVKKARTYPLSTANKRALELGGTVEKITTATHSPWGPYGHGGF